jgi:hypothetical protein
MYNWDYFEVFMNWKKTVLNSYKEWHTDNSEYIVREINYKDGQQTYQCFRKSTMNPKTHNFCGNRETPELAKEYCEILAGKQ